MINVVASREWRSRRTFLLNELAEGRLIRRHRGVYMAPSALGVPHWEAEALQKACPRGILTGQIAAALCLQRKAVTPPYDVIQDRGSDKPGIVFHRWALPEEFVRHTSQFVFTTPAFTAAFLAATDGGATIDDALRLGVTLRDIEEATDWLRCTRANDERRRIVQDSRDLPWSQAERLTHQLLRQAKITGWVTNYAVETQLGTVFIDIAFPRQNVALEIDGFEHHSSRDAFEHDRLRHSVLTSMGWRILHVTWLELTTNPERVIGLVKTTLALDL